MAASDHAAAVSVSGACPSALRGGPDSMEIGSVGCGVQSLDGIRTSEVTQSGWLRQAGPNLGWPVRWPARPTCSSFQQRGLPVWVLSWIQVGLAVGRASARALRIAQSIRSCVLEPACCSLHRSRASHWVPLLGCCLGAGSTAAQIWSPSWPIEQHLPSRASQHALQYQCSSAGSIAP